MTLNEIQEKLKGKIGVTDISCKQIYTIFLNNGCRVNLIYKNGEYRYTNVEGGKNKKFTKKVLGIGDKTVDNDK